MHYAFDTWMQRTSPNCPFARYADDAVVHCRSQKQADYVMRSIASRLSDGGLTMHPEKSKVVVGPGESTNLHRRKLASARWLDKMQATVPLPFHRWRVAGPQVG